MSTTEPRLMTVDLEQYDGRLDALIALFRGHAGPMEFRRADEVTAALTWQGDQPLFDFSYHWWGRERDPLMAALTVALTGEDLDEIETEVANAVGEVRREMQRERAARGNGERVDRESASR